MKKDPVPEKEKNLRGESRTESLEGGSVEFIPGENEITHHFKLKDFSSKGIGILVRKDSRVLKHIKINDVLTMKFHPDLATRVPEAHQTQIKHISEPDPGKHEGHMVVGLLIID